MTSATKARVGLAALATAALVAFATAMPASATAPVATSPTTTNAAEYPKDWGVYTLGAFQGTELVLQETNEVYPFHSEARNVVVSPAWWHTAQQRWRFIEIAPTLFRIINVTSGRALQSTNETTPGGYSVATTPGDWNSAEQMWYLAGYGDAGVQLQFGDPAAKVYYLINLTSIATSPKWLAANHLPYHVPGVSQVQVGVDRSAPWEHGWKILKD